MRRLAFIHSGCFYPKQATSAERLVSPAPGSSNCPVSRREGVLPLHPSHLQRPATGLRSSCWFPPYFRWRICCFSRSI